MGSVIAGKAQVEFVRLDFKYRETTHSKVVDSRLSYTVVKRVKRGVGDSGLTKSEEAERDTKERDWR